MYLDLVCVIGVTILNALQLLLVSNKYVLVGRRTLLSYGPSTTWTRCNALALSHTLKLSSEACTIRTPPLQVVKRSTREKEINGRI